jgi:predicted kinase
MAESTQIPKLSLIVATETGVREDTTSSLLSASDTVSSYLSGRIQGRIVNTTGEIGAPSDDIQQQVYEVFFDAIMLLLGRRITLVAEAAFQHKAWAPKLEILRESARILLARARHVERGLADPTRERFHHDWADQAAREGRLTTNRLRKCVFSCPHQFDECVAQSTRSDSSTSFSNLDFYFLFVPQRHDWIYRRRLSSRYETGQARSRDQQQDHTCQHQCVE